MSLGVRERSPMRFFCATRMNGSSRSMQTPSLPRRNPGRHLQVKPSGLDLCGARRHSWSHLARAHGLSILGCSAGCCTCTDSGWDTRWETTLSLLPRNLRACITLLSCRSVQYTWSSKTARECGCSR